MSKIKSQNARQTLVPAPAPATKKLDQLVELLRRPDGADVRELSQAIGWQAHSVRGAISGTLKKKLGLKVDTQKLNGRTVYRIGA